MKLIYTAPTPAAARAALDELIEVWGGKYGAIVRLWESAWEEFIPLLDYDVEIRAVLCSTNAIESLNARYRRAVRARGHFGDRAARPEMPIPGNPFTGPDRPRQGTMDSALETSVERLRDHLRRPLAGSRNLLINNARNTDTKTVPCWRFSAKIAMSHLSLKIPILC